MSYFSSNHASLLSTYSDGLRRSVLIRNAFKTASSFSSSSSSRSEAMSTDANLDASSSSLGRERWTLMAARAGLDGQSIEDMYQDEDEDEEEEELDSFEGVCDGCYTNSRHDDEQDEGEWFEGLLQEISVEDHQHLNTFPTLDEPIQSHSTSTSSLPSLMLDDEDDASGEEDDDGVADSSSITQHTIKAPSLKNEIDLQPLLQAPRADTIPTIFERRTSA